MSKAKNQASIYLVSTVWTIFQDNQIAEEKFFPANDEVILNWEYHHFGIPNEIIDTGDAHQWLVNPLNEKVW